MGVTTTTTVLNVADHELGVAWCSDLFGREPDRRPMEGSAEWQVTPTSAVMVYADAHIGPSPTHDHAVSRRRSRSVAAMAASGQPVASAGRLAVGYQHAVPPYACHPGATRCRRPLGPSRVGG
jgi:hypothetical protein